MLCLQERFFKEYSISFLMVGGFIDFALVVLKLLMFKFCGIIGVSKIELFNFSSTERVMKIADTSINQFAFFHFVTPLG